MAGWTVRFALWSAAMMLTTFLATIAVADNMRTFVKRGAAYEDVKLDLQTAIEGKGLKIGAVGDLGDMLARTAKDLDIGAPVYQSAHYLQFCSATFCAQTDGCRSSQSRALPVPDVHLRDRGQARRGGGWLPALRALGNNGNARRAHRG